MRKSEARIRAEALALSAMIASMNVMPALADTTIPEIGIESSKEEEGGDNELASPSNATPVEKEEDTGDEDFEFEEELENDLETEESTENENDTESSEGGKESLEDSETESLEDESGAEENVEETEIEIETEESTDETESVEEESETEEVDLEQVQVATPSNLEKPEEKLLEPELMTLSLNEVVYGEWNDSEDGNWQFLPLEDGTCSIKPLSNAMKKGAVTIPEEVDGFTVTKIEDGAYASNRNITSITIPESVKEIGDEAFKGATKITNFEANGVEKIGTAAFSGCTGLVSFSTPNAVELGDSILEKCSKLKNISLGASIIPAGTYRNCSVLTDYDFTGVETIGDNAFYGCKLLNSVSLDGVKNIGSEAFRGCTGLTELSLDGVENIGDSAFYGTGLTTLTLTNIGIVEGSAFGSCKSLKTVNLNNVEEIGVGAFQNLSSITSLTLDNVGTVRTDAFRQCTGLTELNINSVGTIGSSSFAECNLTNINIGEVSGTVKEYAFNNSGVETITIGRINNAEYNSLVATEKVTIDYAENLGGAKAKIIEVKSGNNAIVGNYWPSDYAFNDSNMCETITIGDMKGTVKAFAFNSVTIDNADNIVADADVVNIKKANTITKVDGREVNITEAEYLRNQPDSNYENNWRFNGEHELEKLNITHVGEIENNCFESEKLHTVIIDSAGTIGNQAFAYCEALSDLQIGIADKIGTEAYSYCRELRELKTKDIGEIGDRAFTGTGLRTVDIGNVNIIGEGAFYWLGNLETVNMGNVGEIKGWAFENDEKLITVTMGEIHKMGERAFSKCTALESVDWTCKLETLPEKAFYYDGKLKSIDLGSDLKSVGHKALFKCNSIKELTIPAGVDKVNLVDLCGEYDYTGKADFDNRGYKLIFLGDTDFTVEYGKESISGDDDDSIIINELVLPSKDTKAYRKMTDKDNTDIVGKVQGGEKKVLYHEISGYTKATYKDGRVANQSMLRPTSDGNGGNEVDWNWWSVYKDIGNEVGSSSNVGGQMTGKVIQHTIINMGNINGEIIDSPEDNKEQVTVKWFICKNQFDEEGKPIWTEFKAEQLEKGSAVKVPEEYDDQPELYGHEEEYGFDKDEDHDCERDDIDFHGIRICPEDNKTNNKHIEQLGWFTQHKVDEENYHLEYIPRPEYDEGDYILEEDTEIYMIHYVPPVIRYYNIWYDCNHQWKPSKYYYDRLFMYFISKGDWEHPITDISNININDLPLTPVYCSEDVYGDDNNSKELDWYTDPYLTNKYEFERNEKGKRYCKITDDLDLYSVTGRSYDPDCELCNKEGLKITYHTNDGTENDIFHEDTGKAGERAPDFTDTPTRENHKFIGWYTEPECVNEFDKETVLESSIDLYAKWEEKEDDNKEKIIITFYRNDGTEDIHKREEIEKDSISDFSDIPTRENFEFIGWYKDPEGTQPVDENTPVEEDTNYYAKWEEKNTEDDTKEKITVTFYNNDGTDTIFKTEQIEKGGTVNTSDKPDREGYEFTGWYLEPESENEVTETTTFENDSNVYAGWKEKDTGSGSGGGSETPDVKEKITVTYYMNDGTEDIFKRDQIEKGEAPDMSVKPSRKDYEFIGWYYESECENKVPDNITLEEDTDFYAGWEKKNTEGNGGSSDGETPDKPDDKKEPIKVTYYENDGTPDIYKTEKIEKGDTPDTSGKPDREGYEFTGWYEDPDCEIPVDPSKPLEEDTDYYAGWKKKDTDPSGNGGSDKPNDDKKPEDKPNEDKPNEDNKDEDKKPEDKPDNKPEDKVEKVKVTYHTNDDTDKIYKEEEIEKGGTPDTEGNPDRDKYEFTGWYLDPECKIPVDPSKPLNEDTDLYAGWKKKDTIPSGNGGRRNHGGSGGSTVTVVNVHEDKPEPDKTTINEDGVPQGDTDREDERENIDTSTLDENGVPKEKAEKDSLPKTGDKRNIFVYWMTFISSLSSMMFMGMKDKIKRISRQKED